MSTPKFRAKFALACGLAILTLGPVTANASSIGFAGLWSESDTSAAPGSNTFIFDSFATLFSDGAFSGYEATNVNSLDFTATSTSNDGISSLTSYEIAAGYDGTAWKTYSNAAGDIITFDLDLDATWLRTFDLSDGDVNYEQQTNSAGVFEYTGLYTFADGSTMFGRGQLNASRDGKAAVYEITQTTVPLPAAAWLMMGALGALGVMRKGAKVST